MDTLPLSSRPGGRARRAARPHADPLAAGDASRWLTLQPGTAVGLRLAPGDRVQAHAGRVWLTEPGDAADHFVGAGQCHALRHGGRVVLECDGPVAARVRLEPCGIHFSRSTSPLVARVRLEPTRPGHRAPPQVARVVGLVLRRLGCWLGRLTSLRRHPYCPRQEKTR